MCCQCSAAVGGKPPDERRAGTVTMLLSGNDKQHFPSSCETMMLNKLTEHSSTEVGMQVNL